MPEYEHVTTNPKIPLIINCALAIIRDHGDHGFSMRKVAAKAGMSLGNLQFYFKNKDELFKGVVDVYFEKCATDFYEHIDKIPATNARQAVRHLVSYGMQFPNSEINKIFHEIWTIAERNDEVQAHLHSYYRSFVEGLVHALAPWAKEPGTVPLVVSLLVPFFEGYAMTASTLPTDSHAVENMITNITLLLLEGKVAGM